MWTADRIKKLRRDYKEKQEQFCRRLRVSVNALQFWEQGRGRPIGPAEELLDRLEEEFKLGKKRELPELAEAASA